MPLSYGNGAEAGDVELRQTEGPSLEHDTHKQTIAMDESPSQGRM